MTDYYCTRCSLRFGTRQQLIAHQMSAHDAPRVVGRR
jgi:hypothetical protein